MSVWNGEPWMIFEFTMAPYEISVIGVLNGVPRPDKGPIFRSREEVEQFVEDLSRSADRVFPR